MVVCPFSHSSSSLRPTLRPHIHSTRSNNTHVFLMCHSPLLLGLLTLQQVMDFLAQYQIGVLIATQASMGSTNVLTDFLAQLLLHHLLGPTLLLTRIGILIRVRLII